MPAKGTKIVFDPQTGERRVIKPRNRSNKATTTREESAHPPTMGNKATGFNMPGRASGKLIALYTELAAANPTLNGTQLLSGFLSNAEPILSELPIR